VEETNMAEEIKTPVFVVEDDEAWAATLTNKLGKRYIVSHFASGEACLDKLTELNPELIILDYHLEGQMTGLDTLRQIKQIAPKTTVVMLSAQDNVQTAVDILNHDAYDYIVKGENAFNRLKIVLRKHEAEERLKAQVISLSLKVKRNRMLYAGIVILVLLAAAVVIIPKL
jgi:DNA-binding response OmpR family regulator